MKFIEQFTMYYNSYREFATAYGTKSKIHAAFMALHTSMYIRKAQKISAKLTLEKIEKNKTDEKTTEKDFISEIKGVKFVWNKYSMNEDGFPLAKYTDHTYEIAVFGIIDKYFGFTGAIEEKIFKIK